MVYLLQKTLSKVDKLELNLFIVQIYGCQSYKRKIFRLQQMTYSIYGYLTDLRKGYTLYF